VIDDDGAGERLGLHADTRPRGDRKMQPRREADPIERD
jgi:hypothetical protein